MVSNLFRNRVDGAEGKGLSGRQTKFLAMEHISLLLLRHELFKRLYLITVKLIARYLAGFFCLKSRQQKSGGLGYKMIHPKE